MKLSELKSIIREVLAEQSNKRSVESQKNKDFKFEAKKSKSKYAYTNEVAKTDWRFEAIMKLWDNSGLFTRKKIGTLVMRKPNATRDQIVKELYDLGNEDINMVVDTLKLE